MKNSNFEKTIAQAIEEQRQEFREAKNKRKKLVESWAKTGLLDGIQSDYLRENLSLMFKNLVQEAKGINENTISTGGNSLADSGNYAGYSAIAFPMIRKIFANTIANNVCSIQTLNTPTGLVFYLDFTFTNDNGGDTTADGESSGLTDTDGKPYDVATYAKGRSVYGGPVAEQIQFGNTRTGGQFDLLGTGYSKWHRPVTVTNEDIVFAGAFNSDGDFVTGEQITITSKNLELLQYDQSVIDLVEARTPFFFMIVQNVSGFMNDLDPNFVRDLALFYTEDGTTGVRHASGASPVTAEMLLQESKGLVNVRKLTRMGVPVMSGGAIVGFKARPVLNAPTDDTAVLFVVHGSPDDGETTVVTAGADAFKTDPSTSGASDPSMLGISGVLRSKFITSGTVDERYRSGATNLLPVGESDLRVDPRPLISEITAKFGSLSITAEKRAYRFRWSTEIQTDAKAQLAIDIPEVLMNTAVDAIQLEIDREVLSIMLDQASAANYFWSKQVGKFVDYRTGRRVTYDLSDDAAIPTTATTSMSRAEWYSGLTEVVNHVANEVAARTLRGQANFVVVSPDLASVLESSRHFVPSYALDARGQVDFGSYRLGAETVGTIEGRYTVYRCNDFPRNKILVGYKGEDELNVGMVYAPYVPLIISPILLNTEDAQPRQVMSTRYATKMLRTDYFGTVTVTDLYNV